MSSVCNKSISFYSDAPEWGGQEILSARIASILAETNDVTFFFSCDKFADVLPANVKRVKLPFHSQTPFPIIRDRFKGKTKKAKELFQRENVENLVLCPGNIERCLPGLWAANKLHLPVISYLPLAFTQSETRANLGMWRDMLARPVYGRVDSWIVNSPYQKRLLERFVKSDIDILPNPLAWHTSAPARMPRTQMNVAIVGRIFFEQKGQDILPEVARILKERGLDVLFSIIGEGPHEKALRQKINREGVENNIEFCGWMPPEQVQSKLLNDIDLLLIPSHFESGPIVLFEALQCGCPVLVANAEYTEDYALPSWMLFKEGNAVDAAQKIEQYASNWNEIQFQELRDRLFLGRTDDDFKNNVIRIFEKLFAQGILK